MQNKLRFGELHNVCFNEENYPYDIYQNLKPFRGISSWESNINRLPINEIPNFLEYQNISNEVKQRFERNISPIQSKDFNGITTAFFSNSLIGNWYLKEINENSIVGYHDGIPNSIAWLWYESECSLKYKESEIVYCIMQKLSKYYEQNNKFEIEFNKYKEFFNGTLEDFLECLINENHDFSYRLPLLSIPIKMIEIEGYDGLRKKLIEKMNNLPTPDHVEVGKTVQQPPIIKDEVNGMPCTEFNNLFGADIARKNEVWQYMKTFGIIDNEGTYLHKGETAIIRAFVVVMRKNLRLPVAKSVDQLIKIFGIKLAISDNLRVREDTEIELKEQEIVNLINAFETKTLPFT